MPEFARMMQNARLLSKRLKQSNSLQTGYVSFFSTLIPNGFAIEDALTIEMVAKILSEGNDVSLYAYIQTIDQFAVTTLKNFKDFKGAVLIGIYLLLWSRNNSTVCSYMNKPLIQLFQKDLGVQSPTEMDPILFDSSLAALSKFSSYVYANRKLQRSFADLDQRFGVSIQADIENLRYSRFIKEAPFCDVYEGIRCALGLNKLF